MATAVAEAVADLEATLDLDIPVDIPEAYGFLFDPPLGAVRYRAAWGGRAAARSWSFARALLTHGFVRPLRIMCTREWQTSIRDSVHRVLSDQIPLLQMRGHYRVRQTYISGSNGTEFIFKGLRRDILSIKSTEGIDICWIEEAQSLSSNSLRELTPTIRKPGSEIWLTFNRGEEKSAVQQRIVLAHEKGALNGIVKKTSFEDNPWLPDVLADEERTLRATDPEEHAFVWLGEPWQRSKAQVLNGKWIVEEFTPDWTWGDPYFGADWGFSNDPAVIVKVWRRNNRLYVEYAAGGLQLSESDLEETFDSVPGARDYLIRADSARPETISAMRSRGFDIEPAPKWEGSVKDGISHLRSYDTIVIHKRCERAILEARLWRYKTRAGASGDPHAEDAEILPSLEPRNDNTWDATRYALVEEIKRGRGIEPDPDQWANSRS